MRENHVSFLENWRVGLRADRLEKRADHFFTASELRTRPGPLLAAADGGESPKRKKTGSCIAGRNRLVFLPMFAEGCRQRAKKHKEEGICP